jgi:hypothetical protein
MRVLLLALVLSARMATVGAGARVVEHHGRWESGYGVEFFNVVGRLKNTSGHALRYVKLRIDALDARGKVVASTTTYNESAERLAVPDVDAAALLESGKVKSLAAGAEERFRGSFLKEETPTFKDYRITVVATPAGAPSADRPAGRTARRAPHRSHR